MRESVISILTGLNLVIGALQTLPVTIAVFYYSWQWLPDHLTALELLSDLGGFLLLSLAMVGPSAGIALVVYLYWKGSACEFTLWPHPVVLGILCLSVWLQSGIVPGYFDNMTVPSASFGVLIVSIIYPVFQSALAATIAAITGYCRRRTGATD